MIKMTKPIHIANEKDTISIRPNELKFIGCIHPDLQNCMEGIITINLKSGDLFHMNFYLTFFSLEKYPPAKIDLVAPKGYGITPKLNNILFNWILEIFNKLKKEKDNGITYEDKIKELEQYHGKKKFNDYIEKLKRKE